MSHEIIMPKLGLTMTHGMITRWLKKEGDWVQTGEVVLEIETDKINSDVESPVDGYVLKILAEEGEDREITTPLCIIGEKDESTEGLDSKREIRISPVAKKMAQENGIDYMRIIGTGPDGRIVKEDIQAAVEAGSKLQSSTDAVQVKAVSEAPVLKAPVIPEAAGAVQESADRLILKKVPLAGIRKIVAARLTQSKHDIPHVYFKISVDAGNVMELKNKVSETVKARTGRKLSLNDIIVKAVAAAIEGFPDFNASLVENEIIYYKNANIGVAVNSERGLVVPVVKNANEKSLSELCRSLGELVDKARSGKLNLEDMSEGTFTVSNLGAYHINEFSAIINPPESAILAVGRAAETPCVRNGEIVIRPVMNLTLSIDHRIIDGALAAQFMKKLKDILEDPYLMLI
ncbi:MAG: dihydrolipoamide acetyltransferase family protein [Clostridiales bacterium]|nr:dihydrolipoamide acetyltransferase family protein [Clostridiales bacterium]